MGKWAMFRKQNIDVCNGTGYGKRLMYLLGAKTNKQNGGCYIYVKKIKGTKFE